MSCQILARRRAFTLIELLVVISLIALLAGISVAFLPAIGDSARQAQAGTMVQQWILTAKQKALRDQVPYGIRLFPTVNLATGRPLADVRKVRFIEQPDDFAVSPTSGITLTWDGKSDTISVANMQASGQFASGDMLELFGNGLTYKIVNLLPDRSNARNSAITLYNPKYANTGSGVLLNNLPTLFPFGAFSNVKNFRVIRPPRLTSDDALQLPEGLMIDIKTNADYGNRLPTANTDGTIDILFAPSGAVISPGTVTESINLWVRDAKTNDKTGLPDPPDLTDGQQSIIALYVRSGLTAAHPPAPPTVSSSDPYFFIKDGRSSGK